MLEAILKKDKSNEMMAFEYWLRTGIRVIIEDVPPADESKFNPYHDPRDGRFTFAPGGGTLQPRALNRRGTPGLSSGSVATQPGQSTQFPRRQQLDASRDQEGSRDRVAIPSPSNDGDNADSQSTESVQLQHAQFRPIPRVRIGGNGPPVNDPMIIEHVFPVLAEAPAAGSIVAMTDNILDITGPSARLTSGLATEHANLLIRQIRRIDPSYRFESLGFPQTFDGQMNFIKQLRVERAVAFQRVKAELRPMQVEALRHMQEQADRAFNLGVARYNAGKLKVRLSREEAIGNFVDREVRRELRRFYNQYGVAVSREGPIRIIGREYDSSGSDLTYRIPDARVGNIAFDVSLTRKTLATQQVRGFFDADFRPDVVVIVRPRQLGSDSTYAIPRPRQQR